MTVEDQYDATLRMLRADGFEVLSASYENGRGEIVIGGCPPEPVSAVASRQGHIYVVGFDDFVKIGWSAQPKRRIAELELGLPLPLSVYAIIPGTIRDERALHRRFPDYRLRGEWFTRGRALKVWIDAGCQL